MTGSYIRKIISIMITAAMILVTAGCSNEVQPVETNSASSVIGNLTAEVDSDNAELYNCSGKALEYLEYIGNNLVNRSFDGSGSNNVHDKAQDWIVDELMNAGYTEDQIQREIFDIKWDENTSYTGCNIVLTVEGEDPSMQIIAGAHYDGTGLGDNGSGTALLLANAVGLCGSQPHYTVKYIFFDGEEDGCLGSEYNASQMSKEELDNTLYMINLDSLAFGDYCNIYGGSYGENGTPTDESQLLPPQATEAYDFAADTAETLGFKVMRTADLDGYYKEHGSGPEIEENTLYTNPWTPDNPAPSNNSAMSPSTLPASDHVGYMDRGIEYIYFEATNWFAESENDEADAMSYTGYIETYDYDRGAHGMFMNTEYDTWENLNKYYPGRAEKHFKIYSPLLSALLYAAPSNL